MSQLRIARQGLRQRLGASRLAARRPVGMASRAMSTQAYQEEMRRRWSMDPSSVHPSWAEHFQGPGVGATVVHGGAVSSGMPASEVIKVVHLIRAHQIMGHEIADLDPLKLSPRVEVAELDYRTYGFTEADLDKPMDLSSLGNDVGIVGFLNTLGHGPQTLRTIIDQLQSVYCKSIGVEYMHITSREKCNWLRERLELPRPDYTKEQRLQILERLTFAVRFEEFLAGKFNAKRFGLEGVEAMIPGLKTMIDTATEGGVDEVVLGMPHRGRLNVLANVIRKPLQQIFKEFQGTNYTDEGDGEDWSVSGDVKYHLGTNFKRKYPDGREVNVTLMANPSHLEAVNPVVLGTSRAKAYYAGDTTNHTVLPVTLHGDAAFAGQGVVYESMQLTHLNGYQTGGVMHVICNNQIGFTTNPQDSRSTMYSSDLGKAFSCPVFHVNGDDPEAVVRVFDLAAAYRQKFKTDVIVDIIGYRRYGHNEMDQPLFTQPRMYKTIQKHPSVLKSYQARLVSSGALTQEEVDAVTQFVDQEHQTAYADAPEYKLPEHQWFSSSWDNFKSPKQRSAIRPTGVDLETLYKIGQAISTVPERITLHRQIKKIFDTKQKAIEARANIDWGTAEALAFASLQLEGNHVRLSGQDAQRGTFSHRHAVVHDQDTFEEYCPLNNLPYVGEGAPAKFQVCNSPLSEMGVLGFELGFSMENPHNLTIWEAQFGDFVNGAQVIIDQFISSGEKKWFVQSGLVMLLPHGYDGAGPEHSSCRLERFLQQCDEDADQVPEMGKDVRMQIQHSNWQVVNCTTPANYFHLLRRQVHRDFRKPLIVASPKNVLKLRAAQSTLEEMGPNSQFQRVIPEVEPEQLVEDDKVRRVVFCTGKVYYELAAARRDQDVKDVAICRIEQISPFPFDRVAQIMAKYSNAELVWTQEEPKNMGAWTFVQDRFITATRVLNNKTLLPAYVGRRNNASPAVGYGGVHAREQSDILATALSDRVHDYGHGISQRGANN